MAQTSLNSTGVASSGSLVLQTNGTTSAVTVDTAQNVGVGVTPSAWGTYSGIIDLKGNGSVAAYNQSVLMAANAYYNGTNFIYKSTTSAGYYQIAGNQFQWWQAASGTAGNAITFTQAMTLDASGRLGVGTTSPGAILDVTNGASPVSRLRIGVGAGAASTLYSVLSSGDYTAFENNGSERARIDSSGNLLVGTNTTSYASGFNMNASNKFGLFVVNAAATTPRGYFSQFTGGGNDTSSYHFIGNTSSADRIVIYGNGNIQNTNNSYGALSDIKLKENITDATPKLADLMQVRIVNFNLKSEPEHKQIGVIAQELEQIFPALIEETSDRNDEDGAESTTTKSVKYSVFVPMLIKAIQEQQALITSLTERITALEAK
jgi:hypothetical protein